MKTPGGSIWFLLFGLLLLFGLEANGQFFSKSTKSIPRMGRRSVLEPSGEARGQAAASPAGHKAWSLNRLISDCSPELLALIEVSWRRFEARALNGDSPWTTVDN